MTDEWTRWRDQVGRPGDGFLAGHSRRAALTAHQQKAGEITMVGPRWMAQAVCRDVDPEVFFPVGASGRLREQEVARAKEICAGCPVRAQCLAWALDALPFGVAGGLDADERSELRRRRETSERAAAFQPAEEVPRTALQEWTRQRGEVIAAGRRALAAGASRTRVARQFGVSRRTVDRWAAGLTTGSAR